MYAVCSTLARGMGNCRHTHGFCDLTGGARCCKHHVHLTPTPHFTSPTAAQTFQTLSNLNLPSGEASAISPEAPKIANRMQLLSPPTSKKQELTKKKKKEKNHGSRLDQLQLAAAWRAGAAPAKSVFFLFFKNPPVFGVLKVWGFPIIKKKETPLWFRGPKSHSLQLARQHRSKSIVYPITFFLRLQPSPQFSIAVSVSLLSCFNSFLFPSPHIPILLPSAVPFALHGVSIALI